jgi:hypothetical protein
LRAILHPYGRMAQIRSVWSLEAITTRSPPGLNVAFQSSSPCPSSTAIRPKLSASQIRAVRGVTTRLASGLNTALPTSPECPWSIAICLRVSASPPCGRTRGPFKYRLAKSASNRKTAAAGHCGALFNASRCRTAKECSEPNRDRSNDLAWPIFHRPMRGAGLVACGCRSCAVRQRSWSSFGIRFDLRSSHPPLRRGMATSRSNGLAIQAIDLTSDTTCHNGPTGKARSAVSTQCARGQCGTRARRARRRPCWYAR